MALKRRNELDLRFGEVRTSAPVGGTRTILGLPPQTTPVSGPYRETVPGDRGMGNGRGTGRDTYVGVVH